MQNQSPKQPKQEVLHFCHRALLYYLSGNSFILYSLLMIDGIIDPVSVSTLQK